MKMCHLAQLGAVMLLLSACVTTNNVPSDCTGARAHTDECESLIKMATYGKQAAGFADQEDYDQAIHYYEKAAELALQFKPELYMEYTLNQALYAREKSKGTNVVHGLKGALAIMQQAVPYLEKIKNNKLRAHFYNQLGSTLDELADVEDNEKWSKGAIDAFKAAISNIDQADDPSLWADLHHSLGISYSSLYYLDRDIGNLALSQIAFNEASKSYSEKDNLERWGMSVNAIADIDAMQAFNTKDRKAVQRAINGYSSVITRLKNTKKFKYTYATSLHNLGILLQEVGKWEKKKDYLEKSYGYFDKAMDIYSEEKDLMAWISAQSNQARSVYLVALQTEDKEDFQKAARLFKNAIDNLPHDKAPIIWAKLHRRLGYVYSSYGEVFKDTAGIEYAIHYYKTALGVYEKAGYLKEGARLHQLINQSKLMQHEIPK